MSFTTHAHIITTMEYEDPPSPKSRKKKTKTFTGCTTCRSRKIKCDLGKPFCKRCGKSGLVCQGYQIQLCWSRPIQFDKFGYQLRTDAIEEDEEMKGFQRRNIEFVRYDREYETYDEMDRDLGLLHSPDYALIEHTQTWMQGPFGVFEGLVDVPTDVLRKRRKLSKKKYKQLESEDNSRSNSLRHPDTSTHNEHMTLSETPVSTPQTLSNTVNSTKLTPADVQGAATGQLAWKPGNLFEDQLKINHEWLSNELRFDALLSATAANSKEQTRLFTDFLYPGQGGQQSQNQVGSIGSNTTSQSQANGTSPIPLGTPSYFQTGSETIPFDPEVFNVLRPNVHNGPHAPAMNRKATEEKLKKNDILIQTSESHMPENVIKIIETPVFPQLLPSLNIPTTGLRISSLTRFLLDHYFVHVADLMTVVVFPQNPWKTIYFPRAVRALGDLAAMGCSSNSRMSLLNALLAVSCFNLQSKFEKGSTEMKFFLNLGIDFRAQASSFLKKMVKTELGPNGVKTEKYKDVVTAMLSMNTIDVVWGTMADCQYHLSLCGDYIAKRIKERPHLSNKAKSLHRIFSFLKLLQDSTNFQNLSQITDEDKNKFFKALAYSNNDRGTNGGYRECIDFDDGLIGIEFSLSEASVDLYHEPNFIDYSTSTAKSGKEVMLTEALYGMPNSLILIFSECVKLAKLKYHVEKSGNKDDLAQFEKYCDICEDKLLEWKSEWRLKDGSGEFFTEMHKGLHHNTESFRNGVIVYFFTMVRDLGDAHLQKYCASAIGHLEKIQINSDHNTIFPLFWQGFITGCSATGADLHVRFRDWAAQLASGGVGSYWGSRQIMFEVWRRRRNGEDNDNWLSVHKDWEMNVMLA